MKSTIKSIVLLSVFAFIFTLVINNDLYSQGRGRGMKTGTTGQNFVDANGDGICDNFVDVNGDGINDNPQGYRGGRSNSTISAKQRAAKTGTTYGVCDGTRKGRSGVITTTITK
jgi:hypothetical protein